MPASTNDEHTSHVSESEVAYDDIEYCLYRPVWMVVVAIIFYVMAVLQIVVSVAVTYEQGEGAAAGVFAAVLGLAFWALAAWSLLLGGKYGIGLTYVFAAMFYVLPAILLKRALDRPLETQYRTLAGICPHCGTHKPRWLGLMAKGFRCRACGSRVTVVPPPPNIVQPSVFPWVAAPTPTAPTKPTVPVLPLPPPPPSQTIVAPLAPLPPPPPALSQIASNGWFAVTFKYPGKPEPDVGNAPIIGGNGEVAIQPSHVIFRGPRPASSKGNWFKLAIVVWGVTWVPLFFIAPSSSLNSLMVVCGMGTALLLGCGMGIFIITSRRRLYSYAAAEIIDVRVSSGGGTLVIYTTRRDRKPGNWKWVIAPDKPAEVIAAARTLRRVPARSAVLDAPAQPRRTFRCPKCGERYDPDLLAPDSVWRCPGCWTELPKPENPGPPQ